MELDRSAECDRRVVRVPIIWTDPRNAIDELRVTLVTSRVTAAGKHDLNFACGKVQTQAQVAARLESNSIVGYAGTAVSSGVANHQNYPCKKSKVGRYEYVVQYALTYNTSYNT
eukprot:5457429-Pyramimonas_sp.AAC.1